MYIQSNICKKHMYYVCIIYYIIYYIPEHV